MAESSSRVPRLDEASSPSTDAAGRCSSPRRRGRPPDPRLRRRILDATREVVGEVGPARTTFTRVARRVGSNTLALSRRWPTPRDLVVDALEEVGGEVAVVRPAPGPAPGTGHPIAGTLRGLTDPGVRSFVRAVVVAGADDPSMAEEVDRVLLAPLRTRLREDIVHAVDSPAAPIEDVEAAVEVLHGAALASVLTGGAVPSSVLDLTLGALGHAGARGR